METLTFPTQPPYVPPASAPDDEPDGEALLRQYAVRRDVPRLASIYAPGDSAAAVYLVERGEVRISRLSADGRELILELLGPGSLFGELEVLLGRPRECQAQARGETVLLEVERGTLLGLMERDGSLRRWVTRRMGERQARMQERMETLLFKSANGKVAEVLLHLADSHGRSAEGGVLIDYPITHQEIGNLIGTTRETVSYAFMEFRRRGWIATRRRRTVIRDASRLETVALA